MPSSTLLDWLASTLNPHVADASADLPPWGFVLFCAIVLLIRHMRLPRC